MTRLIVSFECTVSRMSQSVQTTQLSVMKRSVHYTLVALIAVHQL